MENSVPSIVFFGAGHHAFAQFQELNEKYSPVAFCDNDARKHGTFYMNLPVLSLEEIEARFPGCQYLITVSDVFRPQVVASLIDRGIDSARIISPEVGDRYTSCHFLETQVFIRACDDESVLELNFCCPGFGRNSTPKLPIRDLPNDQAIQDFIALRDSLIDGLRASPGGDGPHPCSGCSSIRTGEWHKHRKIRCASLVFDHPCICNFHCTYCRAHLSEPSPMPVSAISRMIDFWTFLRSSGYCDDSTLTNLSSGEIPIHPLRHKIYEAIGMNPCVVTSNASVYDESLAEMLHRIGSRLITSLDAGTPEAYARIHGLDCFDRVCQNLAQYAQHGPVELKYIVLPSVNDNEADIDGFLSVCQRVKTQLVVVARDHFDRSPLSVHTIAMIARLVQGGRELGISVWLPDDAFPPSSPERKRLNETLQCAGEV